MLTACLVLGTLGQKMNDDPAGCNNFWLPTPMMTCSAPCGFPIGFPVNHGGHTCLVGMTMGDFLAGWVAIAATMIADCLLAGKGPASFLDELLGKLGLKYDSEYFIKLGVAIGFHQEASLGMSFEPLPAGTPISLSGVHPEVRKLGFVTPPRPTLEITVEGHTEKVAPRLTAAIIEPDVMRVSFVHCGRTSSLPRVFIPGIHATIPLSARADGGEPLHYVAPPVVGPPPNLA